MLAFTTTGSGLYATRPAFSFNGQVIEGYHPDAEDYAKWMAEFVQISMEGVAAADVVADKASGPEFAQRVASWSRRYAIEGLAFPVEIIDQLGMTNVNLLVNPFFEEALRFHNPALAAMLYPESQAPAVEVAPEVVAEAESPSSAPGQLLTLLA